MMELSDIKKQILSDFAESDLFAPLNEWFLQVLSVYVDSGIVSISPILEKIEGSPQLEDRDVIDNDKEEMLLESLLPNLIEYAGLLKSQGLILDKQIQKFASHIEMYPFNDRDYQAVLMLTLDQLGGCYEYNLEKSWASSICLSEQIAPFYAKKDDLVDVSSFRILEKGFHCEEGFFVVYAYMPYHLHNAILDFARKGLNNTRLRVLPKYIGSINKYTQITRIMHDRLYGVPFNEDSLKGISFKQFGSLSYTYHCEKDWSLARLFFVPLKELQYVIKPMPNGCFSISIEELIDIEKNDYNQYSRFVFESEGEMLIRNRYIHAIFDQSNLIAAHFDFSYLYYNLDAYVERLSGHIKDKVINATIKRKIVRLDGSIDFDTFNKIVAACFHGDPEIDNFLDGA